MPLVKSIMGTNQNELSTQSDIKHPIAKRFMVVFTVVLFVGLVIEIAHRSDLGDFLSGVGLVGFLASALISSEKRINPANVPPTTTATTPVSGTRPTNSIAEDVVRMFAVLFGFARVIIAVVFCIAVGLALLWAAVAVIKWMWIHS